MRLTENLPYAAGFSRCAVQTKALAARGICYARLVEYVHVERERERERERIFSARSVLRP
ncbi:MAG: hypothetical protein LBR38_01130 [Synergistaceae bacterium]|nr:hypothetical protein [Synergistaceae bacterium]